MRRRAYHAPLLLALALCAAGCTREAMSEAEKTLILRAQDLAPYGLELGDASKYESFSKTRYFDNTYQLDYEFETPADAAGLDPLYMSVTVTFERTAADAKISQGAEKVGLKAGGYFDGMRMEERKDFFRYGEESSYYVLLSKDGKPAGSYFVTREGTKVYSVLIAGAVFDDPATWAELATPKLQKFSAHRP